MLYEDVCVCVWEGGLIRQHSTTVQICLFFYCNLVYSLHSFKFKFYVKLSHKHSPAISAKTSLIWVTPGLELGMRQPATEPRDSSANRRKGFWIWLTACRTLKSIRLLPSADKLRKFEAAYFKFKVRCTKKRKKGNIFQKTCFLKYVLWSKTDIREWSETQSQSALQIHLFK